MTGTKAELECMGVPVSVQGGRLFDVLYPNPEHIRIEDIAYALANINRWTGHARPAYSVAQHSVWVSHRVPERSALAGLLHDAAEAYIGDMSSPIKRKLSTFRLLESAVLGAIEKRFDVRFDYHLMDVWSADRLALGTEARDLMGDPEWARELPRAADRILPVGAARSEAMFLARFDELTRRAAA